MVSSKILWNSVISTKDARFAGADIKNMYLETPLDRYEYMKMPIALFPDDIIKYYKLMDKVLDGPPVGSDRGLLVGPGVVRLCRRRLSGTPCYLTSSGLA